MMKSDSGGEEEEEGGRCAAAAAKMRLKCEFPPQSRRQLKEDLPLLLKKKWSPKNNTQSSCQEEEVGSELRRLELQEGGGGAKGDEDYDDLLLLLPGSSSESKRARGGPTGEQLPPRAIAQRVRIESLDEYVKGLLISQIREPTLHVEEGLMLLLKRCLESEQQTQARTHSALALCSFIQVCRQKNQNPHSEVSENQIWDQFRWQETTPTIWIPSKANKEHHHFNSQISLELHHPRLPIDMPSSSSSSSNWVSFKA
jgi:hypothetical protein